MIAIIRLQIIKGFMPPFWQAVTMNGAKKLPICDIPSI